VVLRVVDILARSGSKKKTPKSQVQNGSLCQGDTDAIPEGRLEMSDGLLTVSSPGMINNALNVMKFTEQKVLPFHGEPLHKIQFIHDLVRVVSHILVLPPCRVHH
jgi:hypothetical protein